MRFSLKKYRAVLGQRDKIVKTAQIINCFHLITEPFLYEKGFAHMEFVHEKIIQVQKEKNQASQEDVL